MKRIAIAIQPVQRGLRTRRLLLSDSVRPALGRFVRGGGSPSVYVYQEMPRLNKGVTSSAYSQSTSGRRFPYLYRHVRRQTRPTLE